MHEATRQLAKELGVSEAALLLLAREAAGEELRAVEELTDAALSELITALLKIQDSQPV